MKFVLSRSTPTTVGGEGGGEGGALLTQGVNNNDERERSHERKQVTRVRTRYMVAEYRP